MKNTFLFLVFLINSFSFSQSIRFDGFIQDEQKNPLEMANIMAVNNATKAMDSYGITNDKGKFQLILKPNTAYSIKISYLGMKSKELAITTQAVNLSQTIVMDDAGIELEGVEIVREMPVSIKGDTIVYNADSFKSGTERKLEDVLKKLPGVEVNADGEIEVEGKKVSKLMVEGKDFFDGDTKLGVKNIPADAIDKIQVLRNYNEVGALKGLENDQENVAMNIKLKEGKKNFWFGDMTAGTGVGELDSRYIINPKLFYYSPKYSINLITNFNNIGELPLTAQDYFKFTGGFKNLMKKGGSNFNISSNDIGISLLRNNRAKEIETKFGATNFAYSVTKNWNLSGFGILSYSKTDLETKSQTTILDSGNQQKRDELAHQKNNLGLFKLSSSYKPNAKLQFDYDVLTKLTKQDEETSLLRESVVGNLTSAENIFTKKKQDPTSINQNLSLYYTQSDKNIFAFEMQHLYQDENPFYNANLQSQPFLLSGYIPGQNRNDLNQDRFVKTNKLDAKLDYYYMVTPKSNINITVGNTYSYQNFNSHIFQILDNGDQNDLNDSENNNQVNYRFDDAFLGFHYKILSGKFTLTPGFSVHSYAMTNTQLGTDYSQNFTKILPDFFALYQIKKAETLTYNFSLSNDFTDVNQLAGGYVLSDYSSLFRGNRFLENATSQVHSLRYFKYNMFNFENIFAFATYTKKVDAIKTIAKFNGINQSSEPYNSNLADETFTGVGSYGRSFLKNYKASFSANFNWSKFNNIQNDELATTESFSQNYTLKASTNFKNMSNIELGYNALINKYSGSTYYTDKPFVRLDYYFLDSFSFVSEYEFYHYYRTDKSVDNEYDFLSASLIYQKKDSKWEYKVSATNLLNTTYLNDDSFSQFSTRVSQYTVQPRYIIFSMKYNL
ncbi:carboxypeptidase-like regulatory domain-containing protein [Flavobacterium sp. Fl-77]|uniref:Carboxypeptidase-like regulatory domain-containing protein n=1 Tax=Flavobacterium flavipigmentatum TaxID=2893884 RepID=A0AAJ2S6S5_9FLAO|nr:MULTISPECIES: carboxypeptidase-like regulatory domain-containing protein [unclassified Flavobacterium]MDX6181369.1 carboxypeptidase-like regulatory domain-containing protein [Flavobacterium sp. Fl-33]MDX6184971.1 carboxypeptidase-like regulatory domain-containing protein [Flavobacterium sp. Fl-77]UFH40063.1 carboxypeptidase-like regulatory domain-containing protein [Flavobacterium sp. F-70]